MDYLGFNLPSLLALVSAVGLSYYFGCFKRVTNWVEGKRQRAKLLLSLVENFQKEVSTKKESALGFTVNNTDESASVVYERLGKQYILLVPYNRSRVVSMSQFKVELIRDGKQAVDITQQPGIPYMVSAKELGGNKIVITNEETRIKHEYDQCKPPMYGEEVANEE